jgi:predicted PurR-regulated permease PerM
MTVASSARESPADPGAGQLHIEPTGRADAVIQALDLSEPAPPLHSSAATLVIATLAVVAALWWGQRFLIPLTAGLMLALLVMPLTARLQVWLHSAAAAAVLALLLVVGALSLGAVAFGAQLVRVAERAPEMISMAAQQLAEQDFGADSVLTRARLALQELDRAADRMIAPKVLVRPGRRAAATASAPASAAAPNDSITTGATVALRETAVTGSGALLGFLANLSIIFFIAFFVLIGGKPLSERFLALWSQHPGAHARARRAMLESVRQIRIYATVLLVTNTIIGVAVWIAFTLADLPDAAGWGATAAVLHVVPYLGMTLLTVLGAAETFLAHESVGAALGMASFLVLLSTLIGTLMTAWLQGRAAKLNSAALFVGLVFWGALWGIWGLFLGPALVVLLKVAAEHSPSGQRLARLMQD